MARAAQQHAPRLAARDSASWAAVVARDKTADGTFYYSVATTGVYCRPSCASRLANRNNVRFHKTTAEAEAAGFRPCKRCKPNEDSVDAANAQRIAAACRLIDTSEEPHSLASLAARAGLSPFHFHRLFKSVTGVTPKAYATARRRDRVRQALRSEASVTDAAIDAGFSSSGRFYGASNAMLGMAPRAFKSGGANAVLKFAIGDCSLGAILVAATDKGIASVLLGDDPDALLRDLQERFAKAELIGGDRAFERLAARVIAAVERPGVSADLPLDICGTVFQHKVWAALQAIPAGTTTSYSELADAIGQPNAVRAVASACAANPVAVIVPCHRVVRINGGLSGYRWGIERKRALLEREAKAAQLPAKRRSRG